MSLQKLAGSFFCWWNFGNSERTPTPVVSIEEKAIEEEACSY